MDNIRDLPVDSDVPDPRDEELFDHVMKTFNISPAAPAGLQYAGAPAAKTGGGNFLTEFKLSFIVAAVAILIYSPLTDKLFASIIPVTSIFLLIIKTVVFILIHIILVKKFCKK